MTRTSGLALLLLLLLAPASAAPAGKEAARPPDESQSPALRSLVKAERDFARDGVARGVRESFLAHFASDGVGFRPDPVNMREALSKTPASPQPSPHVLDWEPEAGQVSAAGDLGWTAGPFVLSDRAGERPPSHGHFFSVWRREKDGFWKVVLDLGTSGPDPKAPLRPRPFRASGSAPDVGLRVEPSSDPAPVLAAERALAERVAASGWAAACEAAFAPGARLQRDGSAAAEERKPACALAFGGGGRPAFEPIAAGLARSGDLGYAYGRYAEGAEKGYYVRVWRTRADGAFEVVAGAVSPLPLAAP